MSHRIDTAEILSFRLKVPPEALEQMVDQHLHLALEEDDGEWVLAQTQGDCYLRFRPVGAEAMLTEVFLCNDEGGHFFQRVLGQLLVRFQGDLLARLYWNVPEQNISGDFAEVRVEGGKHAKSGMAAKNFIVPSAMGASEQVSGNLPQESTRTAFDEEISSLLSRAREYWEEYQRLKRARD